MSEDRSAVIRDLHPLIADQTTDRRDGSTITVLMPVRNEAAVVAQAIASVLSQTCSAIELLVIDGRSDDDTADIVREISRRDPRVRLLDNPGRTIPRALNIGLAAGERRYVSRIDAHATVNDTYLQSALDVLDQLPDVAAVGGRRIGVGDGPTGTAIAAVLASPFGVGNSVNHYGDIPQDTDHASFGVFRRDVVLAVGGWDEALPVNEDVDLDHRILHQGHRIRYDPTMEIHWQVRRTLKDFAHQYRRYGRGKAAMVRKNGRSAVRLRHLAAPSLVVLLVVAVLAGIVGPWWLGVLLASPYLLAVCFATVVTTRKGYAGRRLNPLTVAGAFVVMHVCWGLGFIEGFAGLTPAALSARTGRATKNR